MAKELVMPQIRTRANGRQRETVKNATKLVFEDHPQPFVAMGKVNKIDDMYFP